MARVVTKLVVDPQLLPHADRCQRVLFSSSARHSAARSRSLRQVDRRAPRRSVISGAPVILPTNNQIPQPTRINSQHVTHVFERKKAASPVLENPELSFPEFLLSAPVTDFEITLKASQRITQDGVHEAQHRLVRYRCSSAGVKLDRHNGIRSKFIDRRAYQIDLGMWRIHDSPAFRGVRQKGSPHGGPVFSGGREATEGVRFGGEDRSAMDSGRVGDAFFRSKLSDLNPLHLRA